MDKKCIRFIVEGRVQGVFYRAHTQKHAQMLGLTGWVKNLSDGAVEVLACGFDERLQVLLQFLQQGPPRAEVTRVTSEEVPTQEFAGFNVIYE